MSFSRKIIALMLCLFVFMGGVAFMVQATGESGSSPPPTTSQPSSSKESSKESSSKASSTKSSSTAEKSKNANLSKLTVVRGVLTPSFKKDVLNYDVVIKGGEGTPGVVPTAESSKAKVVKNVPVLPMNGQVTATVVVTAEDGVTQKTYTLSMTRVEGESSAGSSEEPIDMDSSYDTSTDYPSENSFDPNALITESLPSEISDISSMGEEKSGGNWLLYVGIALIIGALGGIGYAIYRQFFSGPRGPSGGGRYNDDYGDGYDQYGDGYDDYGPDDPYDSGYEGEDYAPYDNDGYYDQGDGAGYDDVTTYIPPTPHQAPRGGARQNYNQNPAGGGYARRPGGQPSGQRAPAPRQDGQYRRSTNGSQPRENPNQNRYRSNGNNQYTNFEDNR